MFMVVMYQGKDIFQVPIMGYINSLTYVKREIDTILGSVPLWARDDINNIICGATLVANLIKKLHVLFNTFVFLNISIKPMKSYINYSDLFF